MYFAYFRNATFKTDIMHINTNELGGMIPKWLFDILLESLLLIWQGLLTNQGYNTHNVSFINFILSFCQAGLLMVILTVLNVQCHWKKSR